MLAVYGNPATTTNSAHELARRAGATVAEAKQFLKIQASAQVDRQRTKDTPTRSQIETGLGNFMRKPNLKLDLLK